MSSAANHLQVAAAFAFFVFCVVSWSMPTWATWAMPWVLVGEVLYFTSALVTLVTALRSVQRDGWNVWMVIVFGALCTLLGQASARGTP